MNGGRVTAWFKIKVGLCHCRPIENERVDFSAGSRGGEDEGMIPFLFDVELAEVSNDGRCALSNEGHLPDFLP